MIRIHTAHILESLDPASKNDSNDQRNCMSVKRAANGRHVKGTIVGVSRCLKAHEELSLSTLRRFDRSALFHHSAPRSE